jgi:hypothetical protein
MADEQPSLHIDTDWKKQAQEEKRRLAEEEQKRAAASKAPEPAPAAPPGAPEAGPTGAARAGPAARGRAGGAAARGGDRERPAAPQASFASLVQSLATQVLYYLGDLAPRGAEPNVNLDMAKYNVDLMQILEEKTRGNLTPEEQQMLDGALYETRMRFVSVASQYATV